MYSHLINLKLVSGCFGGNESLKNSDCGGYISVSNSSVKNMMVLFPIILIFDGLTKIQKQQKVPFCIMLNIYIYHVSNKVTINKL